MIAALRWGMKCRTCPGLSYTARDRVPVCTDCLSAEVPGEDLPEFLQTYAGSFLHVATPSCRNQFRREMKLEQAS
jgi:hypothetical protein